MPQGRTLSKDGGCGPAVESNATALGRRQFGGLLDARRLQPMASAVPSLKASLAVAAATGR